MSPKEIIKQATRRCMQMLDALQLSSIAFPAIGTGAAGFSNEDAAVQMSAIISDDLLNRRSPVEVTIYLFDRFGQKKEIDYIHFFEEVAARVPRLTNPIGAPETKAHGEKTRPLHDRVPTSDDAPETEEHIRMRRLNNLRKLIGSIEDRRFEIEARLIEILNTGEEEEIKTLRHKLAENQELRLGYLNELKSLSEKDSVTPQQADSTKKHRSVFVSSTYRDLIAHRAAVKDQIIRRDMLFRGMENFGADPDRATPAAKIVEEVRKAAVYLGILGVRYGYVDQATGLSMTELEFKEAETSGKPMFLYVIRDDAPVKVSDIEPDPASKAKLDNLRKRILKDYVAYLFDSVEDLARQVYEDLGKL